MSQECKTNDTEKIEWRTPTLIEYGSVEEITLAPKGWGNNDGVGLEPGSIHPSL